MICDLSQFCESMISQILVNGADLHRLTSLFFSKGNTKSLEIELSFARRVKHKFHHSPGGVGKRGDGRIYRIASSLRVGTCKPFEIAVFSAFVCMG
jgi:hypothetical protein